MHRTVTLIQGDGIGPEISQAMKHVVAALDIDLDWEICSAGLEALEKEGCVLPETTIESIKRNKIAIKGPTTTPAGRGHKSVNVALRQMFDLYACVRPIKSIPTVPTRFNNVDLVVVRENTEGLYKGIEEEKPDGSVVSYKIVTPKASARIARYAYRMASLGSRGRVTTIHKANILKLGDGLFLKKAQEAGAEFPQIITDDCIVDAACMKLVTHPEQFDVLLMENLYGDILSDLCAGLIGGLGLVGGANMGDDCAIFEAVHGSAPDIAGQGIANPSAMIMSAVMMLHHLGDSRAAMRLQEALFSALGDPAARTRDLGGEASTQALTNAVIYRLK